jgi:dienelactone hydrolase
VRWGLLRPPQPTPAPDQTVAGKWVLASPSADIIGQQYLRDIAATADTYLPAVIDWLVAQPEIDPTRLAIAGSSTKRFHRAARRQPSTAASASSSPSPPAATTSASSSSRRWAWRASRWRFRPHTPNGCTARKVISDPAQLTHAAVLMINRSPDPLIPVSCADETARVLTDAFTRAGVPQRFRYLRFDTEGHGVGGPELAETMAWLKQWLASPPSTG